MELAAWIASALVFMTFFMKTMLLLRVVVASAYFRSRPFFR